MSDLDRTLDKEALEAGFRVGDVLVEPLLQRVTQDGEPVQIEPRVMEVLVRLAEQPGRPVSKREFLDDLWEGVYVTDDALLRCIGELRRTFGDDPQNPRYIETIRKRGYRLVAPVALAPVSLAPSPEPRVPHVEVAPPEVDRPLAPPPVVAPEAVSGAAPENRSAEPPAGRRLAARTLVVVRAVGVASLVALGLWLGRSTEPETPTPLRAVPLTSYPGVERAPHLSPDGAAVAFVWDGGDGGSDDLYVQQVGVGTPLRLTDTPDDEASPAWSPDGQRLAFVRDGDIFSVPVIGGAERRLAGLGDRAVREIAWSPDGEALAVSAETESGGPFGIWLLPTNTLRARPLTSPPPGSQGDVHLAFAPDGRRLAFVRSTTERVDDVYLLPLDGAGELKRLTYDHAEVTGLDWTRDGGRVVFSSDRGGAVRSGPCRPAAARRRGCRRRARGGARTSPRSPGGRAGSPSSNARRRRTSGPSPWTRPPLLPTARPSRRPGGTRTRRSRRTAAVSRSSRTGRAPTRSGSPAPMGPTRTPSPSSAGRS